MMTTDPVGFARLRTIALVLGMVAIFSAASAAQAQSAPAGNEKVQTQAISAAGEAVNRCSFSCGKASFAITRERGSAYYHAKVCGDDAGEAPMLVSAGRSKLIDILLMELSRGGTHPLYSKALAAIAPLV